MNKTILYIRSDKHEEFSLGLYKSGIIDVKKYHCPIGIMSEKLLPSLQMYIASYHVKLSDIDAIVVYQGPGSYTSLRIGISCANALAFSNNIPIYSIAKMTEFSEKTLSKISFKNAFNKPINPHYQQAI